MGFGRLDLAVLVANMKARKNQSLEQSSRWCGHHDHEHLTERGLLGGSTYIHDNRGHTEWHNAYTHEGRIKNWGTLTGPQEEAND